MTSDKVNTMMIVARILAGAFVATAVAVLARRARALTGSGAIAAAALGTAAVAAGWSWAALLIIYFIASSALSRIGADHKTARVAGIAIKMGPRDYRQVLANGLPFVAAAIASVLGAPPAIAMSAAAGSLAASAADTWATEVGTLVGHEPRSVLSRRPLSVGESGGVTGPGLLASVGGAAFIALVAIGLRWPTSLFVPVLLGGLVGSLVDSVAGATIQRRSWCDACDRGTEMIVHNCGTPTHRVGGLAWLDNDGVNLLATTSGALVAALL
jgi:uncharacterized protein (TIGR00297 family)